MQHNKYLIALLSLLAVPVGARASSYVGATRLQDIINGAIGVLNSAVPLFIGIAVLVFIYGVIKFVLRAPDTKERENGRQFMIWGIVGLFVIVSVWGIVNLLVDLTALDNRVTPPLPVFPVRSS